MFPRRRQCLFVQPRKSGHNSLLGALAGTVALSAGLVAGGGLASATSAGATAHYKIFMISKGAGNPYFEEAQSGASQAAKQWGDQLVFDSPADATAAEQVTIIDTAIAEHANGIIISADDPNAVAPALHDAMKAGIKVISYDADVAPSARSLFVNQGTYAAIEAAGQGHLCLGARVRRQNSVPQRVA